MNQYLFSPLDVAAYIKWSQLSGREEARLLRQLWTLAPQCLDRAACGKRFATFERRVFQQLYFLYTRGYVDESSDPAAIADPKDSSPGLMAERHVNMETWLKRIALHLMLQPRLPYVRISIPELARQLGFRRLTKILLRQTLSAARRLGLFVAQANGRPADVDTILARKMVCIGLTAVTAKQLAELSPDAAWFGDWASTAVAANNNTDET